MKIMTLNIWGGRRQKILLDFFKNYQSGIDVFCLQEVWSKPFFEGHNYNGQFVSDQPIMVKGMQKISGVMPKSNCYFRPHLKDSYGLMTIIKKDIKVIKEGDFFVYKDRHSLPSHEKDNHARNLQFLEIEIDGSRYNIINFHGLWDGNGKVDTQDRILQSKKFINFLKSNYSSDDKLIICGDFNLLPDTRSLLAFEEFGLINLIKEYDIKSTRTSLYKKVEKFADYIFISKNIKVRNFIVLTDEVSDHAPLFLEI